MDRDLDGLPDWYEKQYGLDPLRNDASLESDHDGFTNIQEYVAGTNPTFFDRNLLPTVTTIASTTTISTVMGSGPATATETLTKTAEGFGIAHTLLTMLRVIYWARRKQR